MRVLFFLIFQTDISPQEISSFAGACPACIVQIERVDIQCTQAMYPSELTKLTVSNAEYPAGKAMLMYAYTDAAAQVSQAGFIRIIIIILE